jgi:hypothetical protein
MVDFVNFSSLAINGISKDFFELGSRGITLVTGKENQFPYSFFKDPLAVRLSEYFEFWISKKQWPNTMMPHLQAYKLWFATYLADLGLCAESVLYLEGISASIKGTQKNTPYMHPTFYYVFKEFLDRISVSQNLQETRKNAGGGWLDKLKSNFTIESLMYSAAGVENMSVHSNDSHSSLYPLPGSDSDPLRLNTSHSIPAYNPNDSYPNAPAVSFGNTQPETYPNSQGDWNHPDQSHNSAYSGYDTIDKTPTGASIPPPVINPPTTRFERNAFASGPAANPGMFVPTQNDSLQQPGTASFSGPNPPFGQQSHVPVVGPYPSAPPPSQTNATIQSNPEPEMEDFGFGNKSLKTGTTEKKPDNDPPKAVEATPEKPPEKQVNAESTKEKKSGWSWFGWGKKKDEGPGPTKVTLPDEPNPFYFDPVTKKWVNKKAGADAANKGPELAPPPVSSIPATPAPTPAPTPSITPATSASPSRATSPGPNINAAGGSKRRNPRSRYVDIINPNSTQQTPQANAFMPSFGASSKVATFIPVFEN